MLLHNRDNKHDMGMWKPMTLANSLYKLWTGVIAECNRNISVAEQCAGGLQKANSALWQLQNEVTNKTEEERRRCKDKPARPVLAICASQLTTHYNLL